MKYCRYCLYRLACLLIRKESTTSFRERVVVRYRPGFALFLFIFSILIQQTTFSQAPDPANNLSILSTRITLSLKDTPIQKILDTLSSHENIRFSYVNYELPLQNKITIEVKDELLGTVLDSLFRYQGIQYFVVSKQIVLKKEEKTSVLKKHIFETNFFDKLRMSVFAGPGISYRHLNSGTAGSKQNSKFNFTGGTYLTLQWSPALAFRGGAVFINTGERGDDVYTTSNDSVIIKKNPKKNKTIHSTSSENIAYITTYHYLSFPLMIGGCFQKAQWRFSAFSGIGVGFLLGKSTKFSEVLENNPTLKHQYAALAYHRVRKEVVVLPTLVEMEYRIKNKLGIFSTFSFTYFATSIYASTESVKNNPHNLNLLLGLSYYLGK